MELWDTEALARSEQASRRSRAMLGLIDQLYPRTVPATGAHHDWPAAGWAMLARSAGSLGSVMALLAPRRAIDAAVLARTLYEQAVTFAWIAINPTEHARRWVRWDRRQRIKADNDLRDVGAEPVLDAET